MEVRPKEVKGLKGDWGQWWKEIDKLMGALVLYVVCIKPHSILKM